VESIPSVREIPELTRVFGKLLHESRLREQELRGLREDKLKAIRSCAKFLARDGRGMIGF
jgi:hypothetical protein